MQSRQKSYSNKTFFREKSLCRPKLKPDYVYLQNNKTGTMTNPSDKTEKTILGIDPGTNLLGYGILRTKHNKAEIIAMGVIDMRKCSNTYLKLGRIYERINNIISSFLPDELAIEAPFFGKNVQSMLKLGRAQGVVIAAAIGHDIPVHEYAPLKIKQAITGNGQASKEQVAGILKQLLKIADKDMLPYLDATDAVAAAYCHYLQQIPNRFISKTPSTWNAFIQQHANRIHTTTKKSPVNNKITSITRKTCINEK